WLAMLRLSIELAVFEIRIVGHHIHAESLSMASHARSDATKAHDAVIATREFEAGQTTFIPFSIVHLLARLLNPARAIQSQSPRQLRGAFDIRGRSMHDGGAPFGAGLKIDMIKSAGRRNNHLKLSSFF